MTDIDISNIQDGDYVVAKFNTGTHGDFIISGDAQEVNGRLYVASWKFYGPASDGPTPLVEVLEHRVVEPPIGFFGVADDSNYWAHTELDGWILIEPELGRVATGYTWKRVVDILGDDALMEVKP